MYTQLISYDFQQILTMLDQMTDALVITDRAGLVIHLNPAANRLLGPDARKQPDMTLEDLHVAHTRLDIDLNGPHVYRITRQPDHLTLNTTLVSHENTLENVASAMIVHQPATVLQILEGLGVCIVALDAHDRICMLNTAAVQLFGQSARSAQNRHISWLLPDLELPTAVERSTPFKTHFREQELTGYQVSTDNVPGVATALAFQNTSQLGSRDIERTGLLRMLIHDLSNPLYIALNFGRLMQEDLINGQEANQATAIIVDNLERMQDLLTDLSLLEQLGARITDSFKKVELDMIVATVLANLEERAFDAQISLTLNPLPTQPCITLGNERLIRQALHNLVENAIKYTLPGGWVRVTLRDSGQHFETLVADSGIGIAPAKRPRLFAPFYRIKDPRMQQVSGTGLGLSLVKMVSEQHGGSVNLYSAPERGSVFVLRLPGNAALGETKA